MAPAERALQIGDRRIGPGEPCYVIAEVGINHNGDLAIAKQLVDAARGGRRRRGQVPEAQAPRDLPRGDHRSAPARRAGAPVHRPAADRVRAVGRPVPGAVRVLPRQRHHGDVHAVGSGERRLPRDLRPGGLQDRLAGSDQLSADRVRRGHRHSRCCSRLACRPKRRSGGRWRSSSSATPNTRSSTASAPIPPRRKRSTSGSWSGCANGPGRPVGYSGHDNGTAISLAAVAMGARMLERHLTLDRTMRGPDHKASLEPAQFAEQVRAVREVELSLGVPHRWITRGETLNRRVLGKSLVAATDIPAQHDDRARDADQQEPGARPVAAVRRQAGRPPARPRRRARRDVPAVGHRGRRGRRRGRGDRHRRAVGHRGAVPRLRGPRGGVRAARHELRRVPRQRSRSRRRRGGVPRRPQAVRLRGARARVLPRHADRSAARSIRRSASCRRSASRRRSISRASWRRSSHGIRTLFPNGPKIVMHVGGMSPQPGGYDVDAASDRLLGALRNLDTAGVDLLLENLPPYPWYFGGRWFGHVLCDPENTVRLVRESGLGPVLRHLARRAGMRQERRQPVRVRQGGRAVRAPPARVGRRRHVGRGAADRRRLDQLRLAAPGAARVEADRDPGNLDGPPRERPRVPRRARTADRDPLGQHGPRPAERSPHPARTCARSRSWTTRRSSRRCASSTPTGWASRSSSTARGAWSGS